jgi:DNA (cytosine-5)-methyltransferase 1
MTIKLEAVDLFAGLGGASEGARQAGAKVVWAANHWPLAVDAHIANHPGTVHKCQDLHQADWSQVPKHNLLLAGPACQGHTEVCQPTRGSVKAQAKHDKDRATAWAVVSCAEVHRPRWLVVENVPPFLRWELFDVWRAALDRLGYTTQPMLIWATSAGVPQARLRVFIFGTRKASDMGRLVQAVNSRLDRNSRPPIDPVIDWESGDWKPASLCREGSRPRILAGLKLGVDHWWTQHVTGHRAKPTATSPITTITGADQHVVCRRKGRSVEYRTLLQKELLRAQGFPGDYQVPASTRRDFCRLVGNAWPPPVARTIVEAISSL